MLENRGCFENVLYKWFLGHILSLCNHRISVVAMRTLSLKIAYSSRKVGKGVTPDEMDFDGRLPLGKLTISKMNEIIYDLQI